MITHMVLTIHVAVVDMDATYGASVVYKDHMCNNKNKLFKQVDRRNNCAHAIVMISQYTSNSLCAL